MQKAREKIRPPKGGQNLVKVLAICHLRSIQQKVEMADFYIKSDYSVEQLLKKYPRENDVNNILYDVLLYDVDGNIIANSYTKKVNELMYFKKKEDILDYGIMMEEYGKFGYCKFLARIFGYFNEETGAYNYRMIKEEYELNEYLERIVQNENVFLQVKDRKELIEKINARQDGKLLKKVSTLNQVLEEKELDYRIKQFATTRYLTDKFGNKKKKIYKHAWKVVRF